MLVSGMLEFGMHGKVLGYHIGTIIRTPGAAPRAALLVALLAALRTVLRTALLAALLAAFRTALRAALHAVLRTILCAALLVGLPQSGLRIPGCRIVRTRRGTVGDMKPVNKTLHTLIDDFKRILFLQFNDPPVFVLLEFFHDNQTGKELTAGDAFDRERVQQIALKFGQAVDTLQVACGGQMFGKFDDALVPIVAKVANAASHGAEFAKMGPASTGQSD